MSDYKALLKHSSNYLIANLATKALSFISIPVYTRLLTVEEYGILGVFMSVVGIAQVLFTLNSDVAISRYYYDAKDEEDFKRFVGSTLSLSLIVLCITASLFLMMIPFFSTSLSLPYKLTFCLLPVALYNLTNGFFVQIYNPLLKSKKIAVVSSIQTYLAFGLSVVFMVFLNSEKYYGFVYGNILAMFLLGMYLIRQIRPYCILTVQKDHFKYILNYCLPYIPYTLSGVILLQFSRIFMGSDQGYSLTGSYTLTTNLASLMLIVLGVTHSAWNPYYFRYMKAGDKKSIDNDYNLIWRLTLIISFALSAFGYEIAYLLSSKGDYLRTMYVLPLLVSGYVFYQWAYVYLRNTGYAKRNIWNALSVLLSGVFNITLNVYLIPIYSELGASMATLLSFIILLFVSMSVNHYIIKEYVPRISLFVKPLCVFLIFVGMLIFIMREFPLSISLFLVKFMLLCLFTLILLYSSIKELFFFYFKK